MLVDQAKGLISKDNLNVLTSFVGEANILVDEESLLHYGHDETEKLQYYPEIVVNLVQPRKRPQFYAFAMNIKFRLLLVEQVQV